MTNADICALAEERLRAMDIPCTEDAVAKLIQYQELLEIWNARINLTGDASFDVVLDKHLMDSLTPLTVNGLLPENASVIDVGSGAGLPGVPLAIVRPDLRVALLDSLKKRITFLYTVIEALELQNVSVVHARAEDAARDARYRERFDAAVARAVAALPVLQELLLPFVRVGGKCICYKGPAAAQELAAGEAAANLLGGGPPELLPVAVPGLPELKHILVVYRKLNQTPQRYPRRAGTPVKSPL
ncbi:MAG: 16S rRNA (guanine(527)-N(7))-methyltransferase RsmG [Clostridiales bacterium]|nr:16S rRNA (guanine(527)-N(7))-methyltransferase RsmG [Clostridiales bacterium]